MIIRICDDDPDSASEWVEKIRASVGDGHSVERLDEPSVAIQELVGRKVAALDGGKFDLSKSARFDEIDLLVVDYDLIHIDEGGNRTTGEGVARLVKGYSACTLVIVLNQFSKVDFDLGMVGHMTSYADVNIDAKVVGEPSLWRSDAECDFKPSYWSPLLVVAETRKTFAEQHSETLDWKVLEALEMVPGDLVGISDTAFAFISPEARTLDDLAQVTAAEFLRFTLRDEADPLLASSRPVAGALATSRIIKWLDRAILRPLDALIDAGHLIERRPFLLEAEAGDLRDVDYWKALRGREGEAIAARAPEAARLSRVSELIGKPVFVLARLEADSTVNELAESYDYGMAADVVYAEDTSRFVQRASATEFRAGFNNFNDRRFVEKLSGRTYGPQRRFAFGD